MERCMGLTVGLDKCKGWMLSAEVQWLSATVCGLRARGRRQAALLHGRRMALSIR